MPAAKPNIANIPLGDTHDAMMTLKQNIDMLTGRTTGELKPLAATASLADCITAINKVIARLNASTN